MAVRWAYMHTHVYACVYMHMHGYLLKWCWGTHSFAQIRLHTCKYVGSLGFPLCLCMLMCMCGLMHPCMINECECTYAKREGMPGHESCTSGVMHAAQAMQIATNLEKCVYVHFAPPCNTYSNARYPKLRQPLVQTSTDGFWFQHISTKPLMVFELAVTRFNQSW